MATRLSTYFYGHDSLNERLFLAINHACSPFLDHLMPLASTLGDSRMFPLYFAFVVLLWLVQRRTMPTGCPMVYLLAFFLALGAEGLLKELFHVPRPPVAIGFDKVRLLGHLSRSFSLPSGHAVFSFMTATVLGHGRGVGRQAPLFLVALLVAWSRVYLGVHYPLDVLAGAFVGTVCGWSVWKLYDYGGEALRRHRRGGSTADGEQQK
ncbi:MAG TPA: phosphatase PAP2 family protein [Geobacteraceae bacterium]